MEGEEVVSEVKFTPGPWQWDTYNDVLAEGGVIVAHTYDHPTNDPEDYPPDPIENAKARGRWYAEANANAHLIAAAPEMYEALTALAALEHSEAHIEDAFERLLPQILAALRKARGS